MPGLGGRVVVTRKMVAERAGVSVATVSYVMNRTKNVTPQVQRRVEKAIEELGYKPNLVAKGLASKRTQHVALLVDNLKNPYYCEVLEGAQSLASEKGYIVSVIAVDSFTQDIVQELISRKIDGLLLALGSYDNSTLDRYQNLGGPVIWLGRYTTINYEPAYHAVIRELKENGHERIAFLSGIPISEPSHYRYKALCKAFSEFGIEYRENLIVDAKPNASTDGRMGEKAARELLEREEPFTALIAVNDLMALGAMKELRRHGYRIPEDISVIGCDNMHVLDCMYPTLSSVDTKAFETGKAFMDSLVECIDGREPKRVELTAFYVPKASVTRVRDVL